MKFKHIHPQILDTEGIGVTHPGDIVDERRVHVVERLQRNPFFKPIPEKKVVVKKKIEKEND